MATAALRYSVQGGSPRIDVTFEVAPDGSVVVQVLTQASLPQDRPVRLGTFTGALPPEVHASLVEHAPAVLEAARAAAAAETRPPPGPVTRVLSAGDEEPLLVDPFMLPPGFEEGLAAAGVESLARPTAAVAVGADHGSGQLRILSIGAQPFPILLFDGDQPGYFARVWRDDREAPGGVAGLDEAAVRALVDAGRVPAGAVALERGRALTLPLPPPAEQGPEPSTGNFIFWRTGEGFERRIVAGTW